MISAAELAAQKRQTAAFIAADVSYIAFAPGGEKVSDGAGGWITEEGEPREPVAVRMIPQSDKVPEIVNTDGTRSKVEYMVLGMPEVTFVEDDVFWWKGKKWLITNMHESPDYERKADVIEYGG